jgi:hypothetical protein
MWFAGQNRGCLAEVGGGGVLMSVVDHPKEPSEAFAAVAGVLAAGDEV